LTAKHEQVVTAGGGDFERTLAAFLSLDVGEIERRGFDLAWPPLHNALLGHAATIHLIFEVDHWRAAEMPR
jgi:hypothetical protein